MMEVGCLGYLKADKSVGKDREGGMGVKTNAATVQDGWQIPATKTACADESKE